MRTLAYFLSIALFVLAISLGIAACGTIVNGTKEEVAIMVAPSDATITVDNLYHQTGFFREDLDRKSSHRIVVSKEGYITTLIQTGNSVSGWYFGNFFTFSFWGLIPDLITGGAYTINPNPILIQLTPGSGPPIEEVHPMEGFAEAFAPTAIIFGIGLLLAIEMFRVSK